MGIRRSFIVLLASMAALGLSCTFVKILWHNVADIDDYELFPSRPLKASPKPFRFRDGRADAFVPTAVSFRQFFDVPLDTFLEDNDTVAFLVVRDNALLYERYFRGYGGSTPVLAFSMSKSVSSLLLGCAIRDGLVRSVDQPVTEYVPELKDLGYDRVTIEHLLQMTSGMDYEDSNNPFSSHPRLYYGSDVEEVLFGIELEDKPGERWVYKSAENQLLGLILSRALRPKTITEYTQERLWTPLGMEHDGAWSLDHEGGIEKTFCCLTGTAVDFAKIGRLVLNRGWWNGTEVVPQDWIERLGRIDTRNGSAWNYQRQWWIASPYRRDIYAFGYGGQYLYVAPDQSLVFVRLGRSRGGLNHEDWIAFFLYLANRVRTIH